MRVIEKTVYKFDELTDKAKEKARDWYRQFVFSDNNDWDHIYDDAVEVGKLIGIEIDFKPVKLMGGGTRQKPVIYFSGFSSQGDGACFEGSYRYAKGSIKAIKDYAPQDAELHRIAETLQDLQRRYFYKLTATCVHRGHYSHSGCMEVTVEHADDRWRDLGSAEHAVKLALRDFADWIYRQLNQEYDYQSSDKAVDEAITANEYEFDENGNRA